MRARSALSALSALFASTACFCLSAFAADLSPGLWEIAVDAQVSAAPGLSPGPMKVTQCLTAADARDPGRVLGGVSSPGASGCTYTNKTDSGGTFSFTMQCGGAYAIQSRGVVTYSADSMNGTITAVANIGGRKTEFTNRIAARRLGAC